MAYIEGHPLSYYIRPNKLLPIVTAVRIVRKVAVALHEAHAQGVVHRDLKPANIMIDRYNEPIVMDFGLARQFDLDDEEELDLPSSADSSTSDTAKVEARLTQDGTLIGSPGYMSPEQIFGQHGSVGPASDVYALGVLLYELLTGELPFRGDGRLMSIVSAVISNEPPDASLVRSDLDPRLAAICRKAMAKNVEDRYESMQAFASALAGFLKTGGEFAESSAIPKDGDHDTAALVRAKEQRELVRSLYQEGQYAAALSILEKMVGDTDGPSNQYTEWAKSELAKVRAKALEPSMGVGATILTPEHEFRNQESNTGAVPKATIAPATTLQRRRSLHGRKATRRWLYGVVTVPIIVIFLVVAAVFASGVLDNDDKGSDQTAEKTTIESTSVTDESEHADDSEKQDNRRIPPHFGPGPRPPMNRLLQQFDSNSDGKLSKAELSNVEGHPEGAPARQAAKNFDDYDRSPRDGLLDWDELRRGLPQGAPPVGGHRRRPGGRRPPPR
jgi:serine/threonine protein kinase